MSRRVAPIRIEPCTPAAVAEWAALRRALWPETPDAEHRREVADLLDDGSAAAFLARATGAAAVGFAEATLRRDYVNGCTTSPVAFLEGIYVEPGWRRRGVARLLCRAVEEWARGLGCAELASDAHLENPVSHRMHEAVGFAETERVVFFRKALAPRDEPGVGDLS